MTQLNGHSAHHDRRVLERASYHVGDVALGRRTALDNGVLELDEAAAHGVFADPALADVTLSWARPGTSGRIVKVLDAVQPRTKGPGGGGIFPGFLAPAFPQGHGRTCVLDNVAVVVAGYLPRAQEGIVELSGSAAALSPLGTAYCLVVEFTPAERAPWPAVEAALRRGALRLAALLAETAWEQPPDSTVELPPCSVLPTAPGRGLPRVGAITNLQTQGAFKDVFVYGASLSAGLPTLLDPNELEDGAVVSGQYGHPGLKNPTWLHQNNPVVAALRARDGVDLDFAGLIISPEPVDMPRKELVAAHAARLAAACGFDAVIVTKEGGGNADLDMGLKMDEAERLGIAAVGLYAEMAGTDGTGPPIVSPPRVATAMISTGNYDERVQLPAVDRAWGGERIELVDAAATAALELPTAALYCALNPLGFGRLRAVEVP